MKPPYAVPAMAQIAATPANGYRVVSTFSGAGGACLGFRMAGFTVAWASEFIPAAADTYRANCDPRTVLDTRDIRDVQPADILTAAKLDVGQLDVLEGSPPCSAFSTSGKRQRSWGGVEHYSSGVRQRVDDLFWEYARLLEGLQPRVFIAENVSGLVKGTARGYFLRILARLQDAGYAVAARLLDAGWLGVPHDRQRLIFVGVRSDLAAAPAFPAPLRWQYTVADICPSVIGVRTKHGLRSAHRPAPCVMANNTPGSETELTLIEDGPPAISADPETGYDLTAYHALALPGDELRYARARRPSLVELRALAGFPADFTLTGSYGQRWERLGRAVPPLMAAQIAAVVRDRILRPADAAAA